MTDRQREFFEFLANSAKVDSIEREMNKLKADLVRLDAQSDDESCAKWCETNHRYWTLDKELHETEIKLDEFILKELDAE